MSNNQQIRLLTTASVARILGITSQRVIQLADTGTLICQKLGNGMRLYDPIDVDALKKVRDAQN